VVGKGSRFTVKLPRRMEESKPHDAV